MEETWRSIEERRNQLGNFEIFPTITFPKEKQSGMMEETCWTTEDSRNHSGREKERSRAHEYLENKSVDATARSPLVEPTSTAPPHHL